MCTQKNYRTVSNFLIWKVTFPYRVYHSSGNFQSVERLRWGEDAADVAVLLASPRSPLLTAASRRADEPRRHDCTATCSKVLAFLHSCTHTVREGKGKSVLALDILRSGEEGVRFGGFPPTPPPSPHTVRHQACFPTVWISGRQTWVPDRFVIFA